MRMNLAHRPRQRLSALALASAVAVLAACGKSPAAAAPANTDTPPAVAPAQARAAPGDSGATATPPGTPAARTGELTNPDQATMVFLYYDVAGIPPPIDQWVERDNRVDFARGAEKAAQRGTVKAELEAGLAAVRGVGVLHLTVNADLSEYDPGYGEFTLGAFAPSAVYRFEALQQKVALKFDNGLAAQSWSVPADQAHALIDRIGNDSLTVDATLAIRGAQPGPGGGTLVAHVVSWSLHDNRSGSIVARMTVDGH